MKFNKTYLLLSIILVFLCGLILYFSEFRLIRGFLGDLLIVMLLFSILKTFLQIESLLLSSIVTCFAYSIEFLQYIKILKLLNIQETFWTRLILGSVFDPFDLLAYTLGGILIYLIDSKYIQKQT